MQGRREKAVFKDLNMGLETVKLLVENRGKLPDTDLGTDFIDTTSKVQATENKNKPVGLHQTSQQR